MTQMGDEYQQLLMLRPEDWTAWLRERHPWPPSAQWWLAMIEPVEEDLKENRARSVHELRHILDFAVSWLLLGVDIGALSQYYAISRLCRVSTRAHKSGVPRDGIPAELSPDELARRILSRAHLSEDQALAAATRRRNELLEDEGAWAGPGGHVSDAPLPDEEIDRLQELEWLLDDLTPLVDQIHDPTLVDAVRKWLDLRARLALGPEVAQKGRELLAQWSDERRTKLGPDRPVVEPQDTPGGKEQ